MIILDCTDNNTKVAYLMPAFTQSRWRGEWSGELRMPPVRRNRASLGAKTLPGVLRPASILCGPTDVSAYGHSRGVT